MGIISGQGGGGSGGGLTSLFDSTLTQATASIDSGSGGFSQSFNHLLVCVLMRTTQAAVVGNVNLTLNNDATANYDRVDVSANSGGVSGGAAAAESGVVLTGPGGSVGATTVFGAASVLIPCYRQTTADKLVLPIAGFADATTTDGIVQVRPTHWRSTAAITRITITPASGNLAAGSRLTVYGLL